MSYNVKFQNMADDARAWVPEIIASEVDALMASGAIVLDIRDNEEHEADHITGSLNISRGKLEMNIENAVPNLEATILCCCNANNRGALSADSLRAMGYVNAKFIAGGLKAYRALKFPQSPT